MSLFENMNENISKKYRHNIFAFVILPILINIVLESFGTKNAWGGILKMLTDPYIFLCNSLIIVLTFSPGFFFGRFCYCWCGFASFVWLSLGLANFLLLCNRTLPFTPYDFQLLDVVSLIVIKKYLSPFYLAIVCLAAVFIVLVIFRRVSRLLIVPKSKQNLKEAFSYFAVVLVLVFGNLSIAVNGGVL